MQSITSIHENGIQQRPLCLVTGGATGLGFELARAFAEAHCDLVLVGDGSLELDLAVEELMAMVPDVHIQWVSADLTRPSGPATLHHKLRQLEHPIDIFVANTSVGAWGDFGRASSLDDELATAQVNALSTLHLTRLLAKDMANAGQGQIVLAGSQQTAEACAFDTVQHATHAFTCALAEGLQQELEGRGVGVSALMPEVDADGCCMRLHDPDALVEAAREVCERIHVRPSFRQSFESEVEECLGRLRLNVGERAAA